ncbi:MAG: hypothetical protein WB783_15960, partial [Arenicellales bacterium]
LWATPQCHSGDGYVEAVDDVYLDWIKTEGHWRTFLLHPTAARMADGSLIEEFKAGNMYYLSYSWFEGDRLFSVSGELRLAKPLPDIATVPDEPPAKYKPDQYVRCKKLPDHMVTGQSEGLAFMKILRDTRGQCQSDTIAGCINHIFASIDISKDNKLFAEEIARAIRIAAYAVFAARPDGATEPETGLALTDANIFGAALAGSMISDSDANADGQIDVDEFSRDPTVIKLQTSIRDGGFDAAMRALSTLIAVGEVVTDYSAP